jgi:O-antigen/teichoic acid export membrane protein
MFGLFVVFGCLPIAALSLNTIEYATFNFSITISGAFAIAFVPPSALLVSKFAHLSSLADDVSVRKLAESSITMFLLLGVMILPLSLIAGFYLTATEFRGSIALATIAVIVTSVLGWADAFRLGHRRDHISSIFAAGSNISIISSVFILYRFGLLSFHNLILISFLSPLVWSLISFLQLVLSRHFRIRLTVSFDECIRTLRDSSPLVGGVLSDYIRLYVSSLIAFYLASPQAYAIFSTVILLITRLTSPISLLSRPLVPAYIDAISGQDYRWIAMFRQAMAAIAALSTALTLVASLAAAIYPFGEIRLGAMVIEKALVGPYIASGMLLLVSALFLLLLTSVYLAAEQMGIFSRVCLLANLAGVCSGASAMLFTGPVGLLAAVAIFNALAATYLSWRFFRDPVRLGSGPVRFPIGGSF